MTQLIKSGTMYILLDTPRGMYPDSFGFVYNIIVKQQWATRSSMCASCAIHYANEELRAELLPVLEARKWNASMTRKYIVDNDILIPCPDGRKYLDFQKIGIEYIMHNKSTLLADEMGLGKTIQAIGYLNTISKDQPHKTLIVCPASLKLNWRNELNAWLVNKQYINVVNGKDAIQELPNITIINYDLLGKRIDDLNKIKWETIIADECTAIKNPGSQRSKAFHMLRANKRIACSGTPAPNRTNELYSCLNWLDHDSWPDWGKFVFRYCGAHTTRFGLDVSGATNTLELNQRLRETIMIRRLKRDVLPELPPKFRQVIELPCNDPSIPATEVILFKDFRRIKARIFSLMRKARMSKSDQDFEEEISLLKQNMQIRFQELAKARIQTALYKVPTVIGHLSNSLDQGKVVVFCHHRVIAEAIHKAFPDNSAIFCGSTPVKERQYIVDEFQNGSKLQLFIGSLKASGMGITLTSSNHVVFAEIDWVPATMSQAEDRVDRIGQKNNVLIQHLVLEGSVDAMMAKRVVAKQKIIDKIVK